MRILEETKDYTIFYLRVKSGLNSNKEYLTLQLVDKNTNCDYKYADETNNWEKDIISLGKKLIKKWKKERNVK